MIFAVLLLCVCALLGLKLRKDCPDNLGKRDTTIINGIFVILIFLSHSTQYLPMSQAIPDRLYVKFQNFHNQWVVTTFLAFSGYGVMHQLQAKGAEYLKGFPQNRLLKTWYHFAIAVALYVVLNLILKISYPTWDTVLSFTGLTSIGNSNWYVFTILILYAVTYLFARFASLRGERLVWVMGVFCVVFVAVSHLTGLPSRFCSTVCSYALGMGVYWYREKLLRFFYEKKWSVIFPALGLAATYFFRENDYIMNFNSCCFVLCVVWFMSNFSMDNKFLNFIGTHAFSIYILQRIPMILLTQFVEIPALWRTPVSLGLLACTVGISVAFDRLTPVLDGLLLGKKE